MHAWLEVDLNALAENYRKVVAHVGPLTQVVAVVKADAYGHGIEPIAQTLDECGVAGFAVIELSEARRVRTVSERDVLIMGFLDEEQLEAAIQEGFVLSVYDLELLNQVDRIARTLKTTARIQLKVETGMNRLGVSIDDAIEILRNLKTYPGVRLESVFSHLASSHDAKKSAMQLGRFRAVLDVVDELKLPVTRHLSNSHALAAFPEGFFDFVRVGLALYGVEPVVPGLTPTLQAKSVVMQVKPLKAGEGVSYNHLYVAPQDMEIAVVAIGYYEGLTQALTGKASVLVNEHRRPILGQICMNLICVDATGLNLKRGDEVVVIGRQGNLEIRVAEVALAAGLRHHEIVTRLGKSLPKVYSPVRNSVTP
jgi:alanine racemase